MESWDNITPCAEQETEDWGRKKQSLLQSWNNFEKWKLSVIGFRSLWFERSFLFHQKTVEKKAVNGLDRQSWFGLYMNSVIQVLLRQIILCLWENQTFQYKTGKKNAITMTQTLLLGFLTDLFCNELTCESCILLGKNNRVAPLFLCLKSQIIAQKYDGISL